MTFFKRLTVAGFAATAIGFGPARMGFGLFVPEFKAAFSMSDTSVGIVSSISFAGFFAGLLIAEWGLERRGPAFPVLTGLAASTLGLAITALAPNVTVLTIGICVAASGAGFAWTPFNDAVHRKVHDTDRPTALSEISTGTSAGIALAGAVALIMVLTGFNWRACWAIFALAAAMALVTNWLSLRQVDKARPTTPVPRYKDLLQAKSRPLFAIAFVYGITSAVFIAFAGDWFSQSGVTGLPDGTVPSTMFVIYGIFGLTGLITNRVRDAIGLVWLLRTLLIVAAASLVTATFLPGHWIGLLLSAGLQGVNVMMISAVLAFWSERLFPSAPSMGLTATLLATAAGNICGPALAGLITDAADSRTMFLATASLPVVTAFLLRKSTILNRSD